MKKAYLTYAINQEGELVHVDSVPNGNECGCKCPHCKSELCAKNGSDGIKMVHHFAHLSGADCIGAYESALHKMAKDVLKDCLCVQLPERFDGSQGEQLRFDKVEVEFFDRETQLRPDCIGYYGEKILWIEFKRTHEVDSKKRGKIISAKVDCIEIDINGCELDPIAMRKFIMEESGEREWINDAETKPRQASTEERKSRIDTPRVRIMFAKDENGNLAHLYNEEVDMNKHSYYCLACGKELTLDVNEFGEYRFEHINEDKYCDDDYYLHEAAKEIIAYKFNTSEDFIVSVPQLHDCLRKEKCMFHDEKTCFANINVPYKLKKLGYDECLIDYKFPNTLYNCDLVIKRKNSFDDAIIISIEAGNCHVEVDMENYRIIDISVSHEYDLRSLYLWTFDNTNQRCRGSFKTTNGEKVPCSKINKPIIRFQLFTTGKYFIDNVSCANIDNKRQTLALEHLYIQGIQSTIDAKWCSLVICYREKRKACYCEICRYFKHINSLYGTGKTICIRYKTKGTPHHPLESKPIDCPYFLLDKEIETMCELNFRDVIFLKYELEPKP